VIASIALLSAVLLSAPVMSDAAVSSAEVRERVEALLGTIDRAIPADRWKALGPAAIPVLAEIVASEGQMPSTRSMALGALGAVDPARAEALARALVDAPDAPLTVRETAVRTLGRVLSPVQLRAALAPALRAAHPVGLRSVAAETLARHGGLEACAEVMDQVSLERAVDHPRFERAAALCASRR
jgi:hypothetical protein